MAFTKVVGPGIHSASNVHTHNINSAGIITATKFVGPFDNINVGGATTLTVDGINISAGILTAQTLDLNGNGDISGNLVLGGDLTVNGTTTTLDTNLIGVDRVEVGAAGAVVGLAVTQSGSADLVRLYDGSTQVVTVDDTGKVGIGTDAPTTLIDVLKTSNNALIKVRTTTAGAYFEADSASSGYSGLKLSSGGTQRWLIGSYATNNFTIKDGTSASGDERFTIVDGTGNVGISSAIPSAKLDVAGIVKATDFKAPDGNTNGLYAGNSDDLHLFHNGADSYVENDTGNLTLTNKNNNSIIFKTTSSETEVVRITKDGFVGIGVTNPESYDSAAKNLVVGSAGQEGITIRSSSPNTGNLQFSDGINKIAGISFKHDSTASDRYFSFLINNGSSYVEQLRLQDGKLIFSNDQDSYISGGANVLKFTTGGHERFRINASGNVKLPDAAQLEFGGALHSGNGDLRIYHTTSGTSWIRHTNSSEYFILEGNQMDFRDYATGVYRARMGTAVQLYYNGNNEKFRTTDTGIDVTGEVAATQDYPNFPPLIDFNFAATAKLDLRLTFTREGTGTYYGKDGLVKFASTNEPRFDHDPVTRECRGLLIEEQRRNQFHYTTTPGDSGWTSSKSGTFTQNTTETAAPDGTFTATKWTFTNSDPYLYDAQNLDANDPYTISMWVKAGTNMAGDRVQMRIGGAPYSSGDIEVIPADGTWKRISYTRTIGGSAENSASVGFEPQTSPSGNPASGDVIYIWGPQFEKGAFATSYIPSSSNYSPIRGQDFLVMTGSDVDDIFNPTEGTMFYEASVTDLTNSNQPIVSFRNSLNTGEEYFSMGHATGGSAGSVRVWAKNAAGQNVHLTTHTGLVADTPYKHIFGYAYNNYSDVFTQGTTSDQVNTTSGNHAMMATGVVNELRFGAYYTNLSNYSLDSGHIKRFSYWRQRLTNAQLKTYIS